jgi:hypothetical protein
LLRDSFTEMGKKSRLKRQRRQDDRASLHDDPELKAALKDQIRSFREKFGRNPGPDDPLFFDPDSDTPQPLTSEDIDEISRKFARVMADVGVDPALIYAAQKTGRFTPPSEAAYDRWSPEEKAEWQAAIDEYHAIAMRSGKRPQ